MTTAVRRIVSSCFVLSVGVAALAIPARAEAQSAQQRLAEGTHAWGKDGWCYVVQGGRLVRTSYFRTFPDPNNPNIFDLYENRQFVRRVGITMTRPVQTPARSPVPAPAPTRAAQAPATSQQQRAAEMRLQELIAQLNRETAKAHAQATVRSGRLAAGTPGTIGGGVEGGLTTPTYYVPAPMSPLDQYIGTRSQGNATAARIRTLPTCTSEDLRKGEWWCK